MGRRILCLIVYSLCRDIGLNVYDLSFILRSRAGVVKGILRLTAVNLSPKFFHAGILAKRILHPRALPLSAQILVYIRAR